MKDHETECPGRICMPQTEGCLDSRPLVLLRTWYKAQQIAGIIAAKNSGFSQKDLSPVYETTPVTRRLRNKWPQNILHQSMIKTNAR